jgi:DNA polymerase elongation subunit (family B)
MNSNNKDLFFQISDWSHFHEEEENDDGEELKKFKIRLYGTTTDNKKIYVQVNDFTPFFYVKLPDSFNKLKVKKLVDQVKEKVTYDHKNSLKSWDIVNRYDFWGFTNYKTFQFLRLVFHNYDGFRAYERVLKKKIYCRFLAPVPLKYKLYETNIEPILRCMHIKKLDACGWVRVPAGTYKHFTKKSTPSICDVNISMRWTDLHRHETTDSSRFVIAAFDIECTSEDGSFPQPERDGDHVIQIGTTFNYYGETECFYKHIITFKSCDPIEGVDVESYDDERQVLIAWAKLLERTNPDIITGYNICGFDYKYLEARSRKLGIAHSFSKLGRIINEQSPFIYKELSSSAMGNNDLYYYGMQGRIQVDLLKFIQREHKLNSYKLDNVASNFIRDKIKDVHVDKIAGTTTITTGNIFGLDTDRFIRIFFNDGLSDNSYKNDMKFKVIHLEKGIITINGVLDDEALEIKKYQVYWCQAKDDVTPDDIFRLQEGNSADRAIIAKYCLQDCMLCNKLMAKLQVITNNMGMANVCSVPLSYIFMRGQGIKIFSLVSKKCRQRNHLMPVIRKPYKPEPGKDAPRTVAKSGLFGNNTEEEEDDDLGYEGAKVLDPETGVHFEPIAILDYASLYPRSMIHRNISHECLIMDDMYRNLPDRKYIDVSFTNNDKTEKTCRYAQPKDGKIGIVPEILNDLLEARITTRDKIEQEPDPFKKSVLNGLQLAYKITANSLYGQTGAKTSPIYLRDIAASTTATGREMLEAAEKFTKQIFPKLLNSILINDRDTYLKRINELFEKNSLEGVDMFPEWTIPETNFVDGSKVPKYQNKEEFIEYVWNQTNTLLKIEGMTISPYCIYGDTDSIFINFDIRQNGVLLEDQVNLGRAIELGKLCGDIINKILPYPHNLEYEKTFWPFILLSKKRYVGNKYEMTPNRYYQDSMGIVLKRRDNAPIVKIVIGGIVKKILEERDITKAIQFTKDELNKIMSGKYPIEKFVITKTLKANYKNRDRIAHVCLADRMAARDPGNKPQNNDRIPFVYIVTNKKTKLQGDMVEHPDYVVEKKIQIDYLFYITNQIMKPAIQFLETLVIHPEKLFEKCITRECNRRKGAKPVMYYMNIYKNSMNDIHDEDLESDDDDESDEYVNKLENIISAMIDDIHEEETPITKPKKRTVSKVDKSYKKIKQKPVYDEDRDGFVIDI